MSESFNNASKRKKGVQKLLANVTTAAINEEEN